MNRFKLTKRVSSFEQQLLCIGDFDEDDESLIKRLLDKAFPKLKWESRHYKKRGD